MKKIFAFLIPVFAFALFAAYGGSDSSASIVTKETLKGWMDNGSVAVLDARQGRDWSSSEFKIKGAHRTAPAKIADWKSGFAKDQKLVIYCA